MVSVDTMRADVAERALDAGAVLINDVSGGRADARMTQVAANTGVPIVLMHWRGHPTACRSSRSTTTSSRTSSTSWVRRSTRRCPRASGPSRSSSIPASGFSKTGEQNWTVLAHLDAFTALGYPVLVAASRKRFLGELLADTAPDGGEGELRPTDRREAATTAISTLAAQAGAWCVRVHEPAATADAVRVVARG